MDSILWFCLGWKLRWRLRWDRWGPASFTLAQLTLPPMLSCLLPFLLCSAQFLRVLEMPTDRAPSLSSRLLSALHCSLHFLPRPLTCGPAFGAPEWIAICLRTSHPEASPWALPLWPPWAPVTTRFPKLSCPLPGILTLLLPSVLSSACFTG